MAASRRLLIINPNTTAEITERLVSVARLAAPPDVALEAMTAAKGPGYIRNGRELSAAAVEVERMAQNLLDDPPDAVLLACFGDPGAEVAGRLLNRPVIGMAAAACAAAAGGGRRFSIITGGSEWGPILEEFARKAGFGDALVSVETLATGGGEIAADPAAAAGEAFEAARRAEGKGAEAIILGGAGMVGLAPQLGARIGIPVLDSFDCALAAALSALEPGEGSPHFPLREEPA